jgi:hypothetical protein
MVSGTREPVCRIMHKFSVFTQLFFNFETKFISKALFFLLLFFSYLETKHCITALHILAEHCIYDTGKVNILSQFLKV